MVWYFKNSFKLQIRSWTSFISIFFPAVQASSTKSNIVNWGFVIFLFVFLLSPGGKIISNYLSKQESIPSPIQRFPFLNPGRITSACVSFTSTIFPQQSTIYLMTRFGYESICRILAVDSVLLCVTIVRPLCHTGRAGHTNLITNGLSCVGISLKDSWTSCTTNVIRKNVINKMGKWWTFVT